MIELIVAWVTGIVFAVLFATFLELLLPSSNMQTFVRVIMGLLIMLAIMNPAMGFFERSRDSGEIAVLMPRHFSAAVAQDGAQTAARNREKLIRDVYRRDLAKQMQALVLGVDGVYDASVHVECESDGPAKIKAVTVLVQPGDRKAPINPVVIGKQPQTAKLETETVSAIKRRLGELYQLQQNQITVTLMKKTFG